MTRAVGSQTRNTFTMCLRLLLWVDCKISRHLYAGDVTRFPYTFAYLNLYVTVFMEPCFAFTDHNISGTQIVKVYLNKNTFLIIFIFYLCIASTRGFARLVGTYPDKIFINFLSQVPNYVVSMQSFIQIRSAVTDKHTRTHKPRIYNVK